MVQLPATVAIEYVAAGHFCPGGLMSGRLIRCLFATQAEHEYKIQIQILLCPFPQVQCVYAPSRLSVPSIVAWRTKKRQTRPRSSAGSRPPLPKFSGYVEVEAHYIFHQSTIWVRPLFTELGPKKADIAMKQTNICRLSGDIIKYLIKYYLLLLTWLWIYFTLTVTY